jgi:uncharacterized phiE125 gp8 family phage protein
MPLALITPPAVEPISLAEAKLHARVDDSDRDTLITVFIKSAREAAEHELGRALITQTWRLTLDEFPCAEIELPKPKVLSIASVGYVDADGVDQVVSSANYTLDSAQLPGWVLPAENFDWPATRAIANAVRVDFTAGYGPAATDVPASVRQWMLLQIGAAVKQAEAFASGFTVAELPNRWVDGLLDRERTYL